MSPMLGTRLVGTSVRETAGMIATSSIQHKNGLRIFPYTKTMEKRKKKEGVGGWGI